MNESREIKSMLALAGSQLEWIEDILDGKEVSDFAMSFPVVRRVWDLKQLETTDDNPD